jgi:hypothetical protein
MVTGGSLPRSHEPVSRPHPKPNQSRPRPPIDILKVHFNSTLPSTLRSSKCSLSLIFPNKTLYTPLLSPHTCHLPRPSHPSYLNTRINFGKEFRSRNSWLCSLLQFPITSLLLDPNRQGFTPAFFRTFLVCSKGLATGRSLHKEASQQPYRNAMSEMYHPSEEPDVAVLRVETVSTEP